MINRTLNLYIFFALFGLLELGCPSIALSIQIGDPVFYKRLFGKVDKVTIIENNLEICTVELELFKAPLTIPCAALKNAKDEPHSRSRLEGLRNSNTGSGRSSPVNEKVEPKFKTGASRLRSQVAAYFPTADLGFAENPYSSQIAIEYDGSVVPIEIKSTPYDEANSNIRITISEEPTSHSECLNLSINLRNKTSQIENITTRRSSQSSSRCPVPIERGGTYLLKLAENLAKAFDIKKLSVIDTSSLICPSSQDSTSLLRLRVLLKGEGWYDSHGFRLPSIHTIYQKNIETFRTYSIIKIENEIADYSALSQKDLRELFKRKMTQSMLQNEGKSSFYESEDDSSEDRVEKSHDLDLLESFLDFSRKFEIQLKQFRKESKSDQISDFLAWLWKSDCRNYIDIVDTFLDGSIGKTLFDWSQYSPLNFKNERIKQL